MQPDSDKRSHSIVLKQISWGADFTEISQDFLADECIDVIEIRQTINRLHTD